MANASPTFRISPQFHLGVVGIAVAIFAYRGWDARSWLMYLDEVFVKHAIDPDVTHGGIRGSLDPAGLLNSFSGYIHLAPRVLAEFFTRSIDAYPMWTWLTATMVWSASAWVVFAAIADVSESAIAGSAAAAAVILGPASNVILLGQLNALQWPLLLACAIIIATRFQPRARWAQYGIVALFVLTALSAALSFLLIAVLAVTALYGTTRQFSRVLLAATAVPFGLQVITYLGQDSRQVESHAITDLAREFLYAFQIVVPSGFRSGVESPPSALGAVLILVFWSTFSSALVFAVRQLKSHAPKRTNAIVMLTLSGLLFLLVSVYLNGNLNHQYLVVPFGCLWSALAIASSSLTSRPATRLVGQLIALVAVGFFSFSAAPLVGKNLHDPFFVQPYVGNWSQALDDAQMQCRDLVDGDVHITGASEMFTLPCNAID
jgi:hypothetical protein